MTRSVHASTLLPVCPAVPKQNQTLISRNGSSTKAKEPSVCSLNFDAFQYDYVGLRVLVKQMYEKSVCPHFSLDASKLDVLLLKTQAVYQHVPYHSFRHSVDVTQFVYYCTQDAQVRRILTPLDVFCVITTALLHDLAHCGVNNPLLIELEHDLAKKFQESPLEEYHAELATGLLQHADCDILASLQPHERNYFVDCMQKLILATDMKHHFAIKADMEQRIANGLSPKSQDDRFLVMKLLLKCADLSNVARSFDIAREWAKRVVEEFSVIGDLQKEAFRLKAQNTSTSTEAPEIQKIFDRERLDFPESQVGFIKFVAKGQFAILASAFPSLEHIMQQVERNATTWEEYAKEKDQQVLSFEQHLRSLGGVIREPIDTVLNKADLIGKPLNELSAELQETETSLIQRRLLEQQKRSELDEDDDTQQCPRQGAMSTYITSTKAREHTKFEELTSIKKGNSSSTTVSTISRIIVFILGAACCLSLFYWGRNAAQ